MRSHPRLAPVGRKATPGPQGPRRLVAQPRTASEIGRCGMADAGGPSEVYRAVLSRRAAEVARVSKGC
jgi:hypothetical protein